MKLISEEYKTILQKLHLSGKWGNESVKPWMLIIIKRHIFVLDTKAESEKCAKGCCVRTDIVSVSIKSKSEMC